MPLAQNERLRINNLIVGVKVLRSLLCELGSTAAHGEMKVEAALS